VKVYSTPFFKLNSKICAVGPAAEKCKNDSWFPLIHAELTRSEIVLHASVVAGVHVVVLAEQAAVAVAGEAALDGLHLHFVEFDFAGEGVEAEAVVYFFHSAATVYKSKRGQNFGGE
jgi:hypothetical protein